MRARSSVKWTANWSCRSVTYGDDKWRHGVENLPAEEFACTLERTIQQLENLTTILFLEKNSETKNYCKRLHMDRVDRDLYDNWFESCILATTGDSGWP